MAKANPNSALCWCDDSCIARPTGKCVFCNQPMCDNHADGRVWKFTTGVLREFGHACLLCISEVESHAKVGLMKLVRPAPVVRARIQPQPPPRKVEGFKYSVEDALYIQRLMERAVKEGGDA